MKDKWLHSGDTFIPSDNGSRINELPVGIYKLMKKMPDEMMYLSRVQEKFIFPYKIYGVEESFVNRVAKTYQATKGNLGILMNGVKGTGKTVTAELICNAMNLPIILINELFDETPSFINDINQDCVIVFDEYEKVYNDYEHSILSVMDGILNTVHRRIFILTTNSLHINDNLLQRPGRIRYLKTFGDLSLPVIEEIVDDLLEVTEMRGQIMEFVSSLEIITIDIVKAIVSEVNIHKDAPEEFKDIFNVQMGYDKFDIYEVDGKEQKLLYPEAEVLPKKLYKSWVGRDVIVDGETIGKLVRLVDDNIAMVADPHGRKDKKGKPLVSTYKFVEVKRKHFAFHAYAF